MMSVRIRLAVLNIKSCCIELHQIRFVPLLRMWVDKGTQKCSLRSSKGLSGRVLVLGLKGRGFLEQSKKEGKDQESIQSSTTPDPGYLWESNNFTIRHHKREPFPRM